MTLILAIDTTTEHGSLALQRDGRVMEELPLLAPQGYGALLFPALEGLLARHGVSVADVNVFAAASGPGTFNGVRVGLACAKGLADALAKPVYAVSNLQALASLGSGPLRHVALDAKRGEVYAAVYNDQGDIVTQEHLAPRREHAISDSAQLAAAIAQIAARRWERGDNGDPALANANYLRRSDAELNLIARPSSPPRM